MIGIEVENRVIGGGKQSDYMLYSGDNWTGDTSDNDDIPIEK